MKYARKLEINKQTMKHYAASTFSSGSVGGIGWPPAYLHASGRFTALTYTQKYYPSRLRSVINAAQIASSHVEPNTTVYATTLEPSSFNIDFNPN